MGDMGGKICMVTGATSGIGYYTALEIAKMGATVILVGRDETKCAYAKGEINQVCGNNAARYLCADLSSQVHIRNLSERFLEQYDHLDVLVNNAGGFFFRRELSADGIEMTFALNHLAYFLLTNLLIDAILASPKGRVVNVSSGSHQSMRMNFSDLQLSKFYNPVKAYACSKLANILFTYELARRMDGTHITSNALTPGMVATGIWRKSIPWLAPLIGPIMQRIGKTPEEGARTSVYVATSPHLDGMTGKYFIDCRETPSGPATYDEIAAGKLWDISRELVCL
jgi:NAD(P)-dependent dehydrogenase (short-subunit alcohol dehydrogenase family)